jgi:hypothetical protein
MTAYFDDITIKLVKIVLVGFIFLLASFFLNNTIHERKNLLRKANENIILA